MKKRELMDRPMPNHIQVNGAEFAYLDHGRGEPVVLVHGSLVDYRFWAPQLDALVANHRVISYSRRSHYPGGPGHGGSEYSVAVHAADLAALISELKLGPVHLAGHSAGGAVAAAFALEQPELVRSLVLIEPGVYGMMPETPQREEIFGQLIGVSRGVREMLQRGEQVAALKHLVDFVLRPDTFEQAPEHIRKMMLENLPSLVAQFTAPPVVATFGCKEAKSLKMPVLLLAGAQSAPEFKIMVEELARCLPDARSVEVAAAGHMLTVERPEAVNEAILRFLNLKRERL